MQPRRPDEPAGHDHAHGHDHGPASPGHEHGHAHTHEHGHAPSHPDGHTHAHGYFPDHSHPHDHAHDDDPFHDHHGEDLSPEEAEALAERLWALENVELRTVGVDVGSSTSHLMFARVHLRRLGQALSSRFVVVSREVLWRSPIHLTRYRLDDTIDTEALQRWVQEAYADAGLRREDVDSGAVILTGEALKRKNARAIADLFAAEAGKFVCASAGHHMEAGLAAHGSGAVRLSRERRSTVLNVDIGGGTSKLAIIRDGVVLATAAVAVGGRLVARDGHGRLARVEGPAVVAAQAIGVGLTPGAPLSAAGQARLVRAWADVLVGLIRQEPPAGLAARLMVTEPLVADGPIDAITFSGGVAEYVYDREIGDYEDLGPALGREILAALADGRIPYRLADPGEGIRATVIGASQFTVQLSGNTISVSSGAVLPLRNLPVVYPRLDLSQDVAASTVATEIEVALRRIDLVDGDAAVALGLRWPGDPLYGRLRSLAQGIAQGMSRSLERRLPLVLLLDRDVGRTLGDIIQRDLGLAGDIVSIDGMDLKEFDYVDVGEVAEPSNVVPVVIKSLLFAGPEG